MLVAVVLVSGLVAEVAWRHGDGPGGRRAVLGVAALALGVRFAAALIVLGIAHQSHWTNVWLNDEASFFLASESLMPNPLDKALPQGLDHLGGDGNLGIITAEAIASGGVADANTFRMVNAGFGALAVVLTMLIARRLLGPRAGLAAGVAAAVWPDLVLWSATFVRDTLGSLAVLSVWWALLSVPRQRWTVLTCFIAVSLVLLIGLRQYLAFAVALGVVAWWAYPFLRVRPRLAVTIAGSLVALGAAVALLQVNRLDAIEHAIIFRQMTTRMEALGKLYRDPPPPGQLIQQPFSPGTAIAIPDPNTGWLLTGLVVDSATPGFVSVSLTDNSDRSVPISELVRLQDARIPQLELVSSVPASVGSIFLGLPDAGEAASIGWIGSALAWDAVLVLALLGSVRTRLSVRDWLFPMSLVVGTVVALSAIPGTPGNAERHRATQTVPLLLVLASSIVASWASFPAAQRGGALLPTRVRIPGKVGAAVPSETRSDV